MKQSALLLAASFALLMTACGSQRTQTVTGTMAKNGSAVVNIERGTVNVYKPLAGAAADSWLAQLTGSGASTAPAAFSNSGLQISGDYPGQTLLVRVPGDHPLTLTVQDGDASVTDIAGPVDVKTGRGSIRVMVPGYAQATATDGHVTVFMGAETWPGTLHFGTHTGELELWINADAHFHARLHTDNGTIFSDFNVKGTSSGTSETIDTDIGGPSKQGVDVEVHAGAIRLLQLKPQV